MEKRRHSTPSNNTQTELGIQFINEHAIFRRNGLSRGKEKYRRNSLNKYSSTMNKAVVGADAWCVAMVWGVPQPLAVLGHFTRRERTGYPNTSFSSIACG